MQSSLTKRTSPPPHKWGEHPKPQPIAVYTSRPFSVITVVIGTHTHNEIVPGSKFYITFYITLAFSMIPNAKRREQNQTWSPTRGNKIRSGCLAPAFLGAQKRAEMLRQPCILGGPQCQARGAKIQKWSPTKRNNVRSGCLTPTFSGAEKRAEMLRHPCMLRDPQCQARGAKSEVVPNKGEQNQKWLPHPYLLGGPKEGRNATSPLHSRGSPTPSAGSKIRSGPQQRGAKSEVAASPLPSRGPKEGRNATSPLHSRGAPRPARGAKSEVAPNKEEQYQKWLPHPYLVGGPKEGGNATSPLHSRGSPTPSAGSQNSEVAPNKGEQNQKWLPHPYLLGGPKEGRNATSPLHSRGSPMPSAGSKIRSGPQQRGAKSEVAASPLPSWGPKRGQKCYITPAFSEIPNAKRGEQNQKWSPTKGNTIGSGCLTPSFLGAEKRAEMLHFPFNMRGPPHQARGAKIQKWSPTKGNKIRSGCLTLAFSGAQKRAEMLRHPCNLRDPQCQAQGAKSEVASQPYLLGGPEEGRNARSPLHSRGSPTASTGSQNSEVVPNKEEQYQKWLPHTCLLGGPKEGRNATSPLHSRGSPTASAGSQIRSGPQHRGTIPEVAASPLPSCGPKRGHKCYVTPAFSGIPNAKRREQNQKWLLSPTFLGAQKRAEMLGHPCILGDPQRQARGAKIQKWSPTKRNNIRSGCLTLAFSGAQKRAEMLRHPCILGDPQRQARGAKIQKWSPTKGSKITSGCLTPTFLGAQKRAEMLRHPCILGDPQRRARGAKSEVVPNKGEQNQKCLPHPYLLGGPKEGRNATSPLHSRGSPAPSAGSKIRSGPQQRGAKSEVAASPLPSRGPKRG